MSLSTSKSVAEAEKARDEETTQLLPSSGAKQTKILGICTEALDTFKGLLVVIMTWAHVQLTLMSPAEQSNLSSAHFIGNAAASLCFLGFMLSYGFTCDIAYISDSKKRCPWERTRRVLRSAALPIVGAWICGFGWAWMCFKLPMDLSTTINILDFRATVGNGPDFLLCFTTCLLIMNSLRSLVNFALEQPPHATFTLTHGNNATTTIQYARGLRWGCVAFLLLGPLALSRVSVHDCTGVRKYYGYFFDCTIRDAFAPVLPALPHLLYFNAGLLLARGVKAIDDNKVDIQIVTKVAAMVLFVSAGLTAPLIKLWSYNFGNLSMPVQLGSVSMQVNRGFVDGPSPLWLLGNVFPVSAVLLSVLGGSYWAGSSKANNSPGHFIIRELQNLGEHILLYLIIADLCLAGLYRGTNAQNDNFPLSAPGCAAMTFGILFLTRAVQYLCTSSRRQPAALEASSDQ